MSKTFFFTGLADDLTTTVSDLTTQVSSINLDKDNSSKSSSPSIPDEALLQMAEEYTNSTINKMTHTLPTNYDLTEINQSIKDLWNQIDHLYDLIKPQCIEIRNFHCLNVNTADTTVKEKVNSLFFNALIPLNWKVSVTWSETPQKNEIDCVTITMLNFLTKQKALEKLTKYFEKKDINAICF